MHIDLLRQVNQHRQSKVPLALITDIAKEQHYLYRSEADKPENLREQLAMAEEAISLDQCRYVEEESSQVFVQPFNPPLRVIVVGGVHIAEDLIKIASRCGFQVILVDPHLDAILMRSSAI